MSVEGESVILIGLNGRKGSGKNTAASFVQYWGRHHTPGLRVAERAFAELLKLSAARSFGLATNINDAVVLMDSLKEGGTIDIAIPGQSVLHSISGREFLKWYGTEGHRDVFGEDFWVDQLLPTGFDQFGNTWLNNFEVDDEFADICLITDCRFANEARRIRELGGQVWNIDRGMDSDGHLSEQPLPSELIDLVIPNHDSLEALEWNVTNAIAELYGRVRAPSRA